MYQTAPKNNCGMTKNIDSKMVNRFCKKLSSAVYFIRRTNKNIADDRLKLHILPLGIIKATWIEATQESTWQYLQTHQRKYTTKIQIYLQQKLLGVTRSLDNFATLWHTSGRDDSQTTLNNFTNPRTALWQEQGKNDNLHHLKT